MPEEIIQRTETTNAVLKATIDGLAKLTDERFGTLKESLMRIENANYMTVASYNLSSVAIEDRLKEELKKHTESIRELYKKAEDNRSYIDQIRGVGIAALFVVPTITTFATVIISHYWK